MATAVHGLLWYNGKQKNEKEVFELAVTAVHRPTKAIISRKAIRHNIENEIKRLKPGVELWAVVKADAYGHGMIEVATEAKKAGATGFCVAYLDEALALREAGFEEMILVLGVLEPVEEVVLAAKNNISLVAASLSWLERAKPLLEAQNESLKIHIAIDSGMGRIGLTETAEMQDVKAFLADNTTTFKQEGLFTHFATADEVDERYFHKQQDRFLEAQAIFGKDFPYIHTANTATSLWHDAWDSNAIRFGVGIYGMNPSGTAIPSPYPLEPAMSIETELIFVKELPQGESISYGATYTTSESEWIGTLPIGYADGWIRRYTGFDVLIDGKKAPIVGRICMDQLMIHLPKEYPVGTKVVLIGRSGDLENTFEMAAEHIGTINYELTCILGERLPREYIE